ncbi:MAG: hypothetical protein KatS3mg078_0877 [Deltaproteobacteria bacterium]|jgi:hypothetical protein|nr:MAG: hypothetical protein KatS3mg078_0877 [Deltaproteobacteria bacterium]
MKLIAIIVLLTLLNSCSGNSEGAGYWFHFVFVIIPLIVIGTLILRKAESISDSLFVIEGQIKKALSKLENLEEKLKKFEEKNNNTK